MAGTREPASCFHQASNSIRDMPSAPRAHRGDRFAPPKRCRISDSSASSLLPLYFAGFHSTRTRLTRPTRSTALTPRTSSTFVPAFSCQMKHFPVACLCCSLGFCSLLSVFSDAPDWEHATQHRPAFRPPSPSGMRIDAHPIEIPVDALRTIRRQVQRVFRRDPRIVRRIADPPVAVVKISRPAVLQLARVERGEKVVSGRESIAAIVLELAHRILFIPRAARVRLRRRFAFRRCRPAQRSDRRPSAVAA